jgi:DNA polymerase-3 subunit alpha
VSHASFVHLRVHTAYSLLEGALHPADLARLCRAHAMPACAMTDTGNLFGALEFSKLMSGAGIQPIIGCTLALARGDSERRPDQKILTDSVVVLAKDETGYHNLIKLSSKSYLETSAGDPPHITFDDLAFHGEGLIVLTGGPGGPMGRLILDGQVDAARAWLKAAKQTFGDRLYVEIMRHGTADERATEEPFLEFAYEFEVPLVATNQAFFESAQNYEAHDALLCIAEGTYVDEQKRRRVTPEHRFKTAEEMRALFADLPEAIDTTLVIAQRCAVMAPFRDPMLPRFTRDEAVSEADMLRQQAREGLKSRLEHYVYTPEMDAAAREKIDKTYFDRLEFELDVIISMKFAGYFLIVADFMQWANRQGVPVGPGRGSGAGSVVAWALMITGIDPIRNTLIFERFLNPERVSMPDFDIDFCQDRRDEVIRYVQDKYGRDRVAQIITFGKLQARAALRDVGRVLQMPYGEVDRLCKMVPNNPANPISLPDAIATEPRLQEARKDSEAVAKLLDIATQLEGLYRHASTHAAGVVIGAQPLEELVPLYRDPRSDMPVTQFNVKWVESAGLIKFDFLGLKTLTVLQQACKLIKETRGIELDLSALPLDDKATFDLMGRAETLGVFQFESTGMRDMVRGLKPNKFEDFTALVALYRPGPMDSIPTYIKRAHGEEKPDYLHPKLEPVLKETYGVITYQENVLQIAQEMAGFTLGQADLLRRAMGKKIPAEMAAQREKFMAGALERGVDKALATHVFDLCEKFAGYGFPKAHAAAYGLIAYQTAYLKANYPVEFLAASMTLDINNTEKLGQFRQELTRLGETMLPPDINRSAAIFSVEGYTDEDGNPRRAVRYALGAIRNVGIQAMEALVAERKASGPFKDLADFANRVDPRVVNKRQLENMARAGAFDSLNPNRAQVLAAIETILKHANRAAEDRVTKQASLFGEAAEQPETLILPEVQTWSQLEALQNEFAALGSYLSAHPLDAYRATLTAVGVEQYAGLEARLTAEDTRAKLAGTISRVKERKSARGKPFAFIALSDPSGEFEVTAFSEALAECRDMLTIGRSVVVTLDARMDGDTPRLTAQSFASLEDVTARAAMGLRITLNTQDAVPGIRMQLQNGPRGRSKVSLLLLLEDGTEVEVALPGGYTVSPQLVDAIRHVSGVVDAGDFADHRGSRAIH